MSTYALKQAIVIPAGTLLEESDILGDGGLEVLIDDLGMMRLFIGRAAALQQDMIVPRPVLRVVQ